MFNHCAKINGVASLEMFKDVVMKPLELLYSSLSMACCGVGGDKIFWSMVFTFELVDETLFMPIGLPTPLLLPVEKRPSNFVI